ncbi:type III-A CRISPR-associated protein Cas10/Csm1 [Methanobrevibacter filiformis]|uniref:HD domain protein n=1 Tax=Methanobrevibacter filiformis TaxID=55758 RepID=A0A166ESA5_9EURY|nr:HD domain protein [Methanobrevibacter filiformis]
MENLENIQLAALLHDIGKFYQRTELKHESKYGASGMKGNHSKWSADFVQQVFENEEIENLVLNHHSPSDSTKNIADFSKIIRNSDCHSAMERIDEKEKGEPKKDPLYSVFSRTQLGDTESDLYYVPLEKLQFDSEGFEKLKPIKQKEKVSKGWKLVPEYKKLWSEFFTEIKQFKTMDFQSWLSLMKKYTSTIPSASYVSQPDISLYDHSKITAALATCRYYYKIEEGKLKTTSPYSEKQSVYLMIGGDISGIQKFIFRVSSPENARKGMSKRLRGRSLYLSLFNEGIATKIIEDLKLSSANILFCGGGRFTIIAPNIESVKKGLEQIKRDINHSC